MTSAGDELTVTGSSNPQPGDPVAFWSPETRDVFTDYPSWPTSFAATTPGTVPLEPPSSEVDVIRQARAAAVYDETYRVTAIAESVRLAEGPGELYRIAALVQHSFPDAADQLRAIGHDLHVVQAKKAER